MQKGSTRLGWPVDDILPLFHATKMFALNHFFYDKSSLTNIIIQQRHEEIFKTYFFNLIRSFLL
jgi:hypothetical protein